MYWNVPKDHRKIQRAILTTWTTTQRGVMLSPPVLSWELPILSPVLCQHGLMLWSELSPSPLPVGFLAALMIAWWLPILSYMVTSKHKHMGSVTVQMTQTLVCLLCFFRYLALPRGSLHLEQTQPHFSHFTATHICEYDSPYTINGIGLRAWLCASAEVRWVALIQLSGLCSSGQTEWVWPNQAQPQASVSSQGLEERGGAWGT